MTLEFDHKRKEKKEERKNITEVGLTLKRRVKKKKRGKEPKLTNREKRRKIEKCRKNEKV